MRSGRLQWPSDEATGRLEVVELEVVEPQRLGFGVTIDDFWTTRSLRELAEAQGVGVLADVENIQGESVSDEEAEAFIMALGL